MTTASKVLQLTSPFVKTNAKNILAFNKCHIFTTVFTHDVDRCKENGSRRYSTVKSQTDNEQLGNGTSSDILPGSKIPSWPTLPFFGNFFSILRHKDFDENRIYKIIHAMHRDLGPVFKISGPMSITAVFFTQPEDIKAMLAETGSNPNRGAFHAVKHIRDNADGDFFQKKAGILPENNHEWRRVRSNIQTPIMKVKNMEQYLGTMDDVALDFVERIKELRNQHQEVPENFLTEIYKWALESLSTVALNRRMGCLSKNLEADSYQMKLIDSVNGLFKNMQHIDHYPVWKIYRTKKYTDMKDCHDFIVKIADENVRAAEESLTLKDPTKDNLTILETYLLTKELTRVDVITFMTDLFIGGIDTTSHTVAFTLYSLSKNPEKLRTLQSHLDNILGDGKSPITTDQLAAMSYLKYCIKEALRILPVTLGTARIFEKDTVINKYLIPKGWQGVGTGSLMGHSETYFSQPKSFIPERWQRSRPNGAIHPYTAIPFSHGTRSCVGRRIAEQEMYTLLARICHQFDIEYNYDDLDPLQYVIITPDKPLKFKFTDRQKF